MERGKQRIAIPNPHGRDIGARLIAQIIREVRITVREFENL